MVRPQALIPRAAMDLITQLLKGDQVLAHPDPVARAAYDARIGDTIAATGPAADPEAPDPELAPELEHGAV
jgi:hypothetical protein